MKLLTWQNTGNKVSIRGGQSKRKMGRKGSAVHRKEPEAHLSTGSHKDLLGMPVLATAPPSGSVSIDVCTSMGVHTHTLSRRQQSLFDRSVIVTSPAF